MQQIVVGRKISSGRNRASKITKTNPQYHISLDFVLEIRPCLNVFRVYDTARNVIGDITSDRG